MSVRVISFTVPPAAFGKSGGWSCVTPVGLVTAEPGVQVTIAIGESWEQTADALRALREQRDPADE